MRASVARCSQTPPAGHIQQEFSGFKPLLTQQLHNPVQSYHLQLFYLPDNGGTMPNKSLTFTPPSILFRPHQIQLIVKSGRKSNWIWWRRRVPPPGPNGLLCRPFIVIAVRQQYQYRKLF